MMRTADSQLRRRNIREMQTSQMLLRSSGQGEVFERCLSEEAMKQMKRLLSLACLVIFCAFGWPDKCGQCRNERNSDRVAAGRFLRILLCSTGKAVREGGPQTNLCEVHHGPSHARGDEGRRHRYRLWRNASVHRRGRRGNGYFGLLLSRDREYLVDYATFRWKSLRPISWWERKLPRFSAPPRTGPC